MAAAELARWPWVAPPRASSLYPHFAELFEGAAFPADRIECTSPMAVCALVQDGRTLGLLSASVPERLPVQDIRVLRLEPAPRAGPLGIYQVRGRGQVEAAAAMVAAFREAARAAEPLGATRVTRHPGT